MAKRKPKNTPAKRLAATTQRSPCPIAGALDLLGDKWTLLVVRDLMAGKKTYGELSASPEAIPTNLLADRLKRLTAAGVVTKKAYQQNPPRYEYLLSESGWRLQPVLEAIVAWGLEHVRGTEARIRFGR